jgi:FtsZ-binding cell division protein ZapB
VNFKPSQRIRPVYRMIDEDKIIEAIRLIQLDIEELKIELNGEYPSIVKDAIEDTLNRYTFDLGYLERRLSRLKRKNNTDY